MAVLYRHIRLDKNVPFYIGIGKTEKRAYTEKGRNEVWNYIIQKTNYRVDILFDDLTWEEACEKEKEFIALYGRKDLGKGTLCNMTDGGEGGSNVIISDEIREKRRENGLKRKGKPHTERSKDKIRQSKLGKPGKKLTEETKQKLREISQKPIKPYYSESKSCWRVRFRRRPLRIDLGYFKGEQEAWDAIKEWEQNQKKLEHI